MVMSRGRSNTPYRSMHCCLLQGMLLHPTSPRNNFRDLTITKFLHILIPLRVTSEVLVDTRAEARDGCVFLTLTTALGPTGQTSCRRLQLPAAGSCGVFERIKHDCSQS